MAFRMTGRGAVFGVTGWRRGVQNDREGRGVQNDRIREVWFRRSELQ